ncbi:hypothetical protein GCM10017771_67240 [Streptomyces capitiformicae]|uniref:Uncharacterized protein n=2 Tax=Streptomyces capitiformicae TaxID=2014920 RepID=A0A918ZD70_9ACTN|nr:hypothetical protein GCM10017771_67240 [Streptomyces capitiformicae]
MTAAAGGRDGAGRTLSGSQQIAHRCLYQIGDEGVASTGTGLANPGSFATRMTDAAKTVLKQWRTAVSMPGSVMASAALRTTSAKPSPSS